MSDELMRDYAEVLETLCDKFGSFELASTGSGFYALTGSVPPGMWRGQTKAQPGDYVLVTDANDAGLLPLSETTGFGVGVYDADGQQVVYYCDTQWSPDPPGVASDGADIVEVAAEIGDLIAIATYIRTVRGTNLADN